MNNGKNGRNGRNGRIVDRALGVGYIRVSTFEQTQSGLGLEAQRDRIQSYAAMRGITLSEIIEDAGVSAGIPLANRPGGSRLWELLKRGKVGAVIAVKLDRLFRDTHDCLGVVNEWDRRGVGLHVVDLGGNAVDTQSAAGRFMLTVLAGVAEMERGQVRERTAAALERKRARGEKTGGSVPFGFDAQGRRLVRNAAEALVVETMQELREAGASLRKIASRLNGEGIVTKQGRTWKAEQVSSALRNAERFGVVC